MRQGLLAVEANVAGLTFYYLPNSFNGLIFQILIKYVILA
jgi:hypothetical protein